jgi:hypothetical protein
MFSEIYDLQNEFSKGIKRIYDYNYSITKEGSLGNSILFFKQNLVIRHEYMIDYTKYLKEGIIDPMKNFLETQITNGRRYHIEIKEFEREFKYVSDNLEKIKQVYHSSVKATEEAKIQLEQAKNNINISEPNKLKFANKVTTLAKEAHEAEIKYIDYISEANTFRDKYTEGINKILDEFQSMEEKYIDNTKEYLKKYFEFEFNKIQNLSKDYERKLYSIETINSQDDIKEFIEKNATNLPLPFKFEFIPYSSEVQTKISDQSPNSLEIINNVKHFISSNFYTEVPEATPDPQEAKVMSEILNTINNSWEGKLNEEEKKLVTII